LGWSRYLDYKSIIADCVIHRHPVIPGTDLIQLLGISGATIAFGFRNLLENLLAGILIVFARTCRRIQTRDSSRELAQILDFCSSSQIHQWSQSKI
jgi:hypothetical protein